MPDLTKILVIGGYYDNDDDRRRLDNVEVVDLASDTSSCVAVANVPTPVSYALGAIVEGRPRVCGGYDVDQTALCYEYDYDGNQWETVDSLTTPRNVAAGSLIDSATWLITGGYDGGAYISSTEERGLGDTGFSSGPSLPQVFGQHCQVTVDPNHVVVLGGYNGTEYDTAMYGYDVPNGEW